TFGLLKREHVRQRGQRSNSLNGAEDLRIRVSGIRKLLDTSVHLPNLLGENLQRRKYGSERRDERRRYLYPCSPAKRLRRARANARSRRFHRSSDVVDQLDPTSHEDIASTNDRHVGGGLLVTMLDTRQQLGIQPCHARQQLGIHLVALAGVLRDQAQLASIRDEHFMPKLLQ